MISTGGDETLATGAGTELLAGWAGLASAGSRSLGPNLRQSELAQAHSGAGTQALAANIGQSGQRVRPRQCTMGNMIRVRGLT